MGASSSSQSSPSDDRGVKGFLEDIVTANRIAPCFRYQENQLFFASLASSTLTDGTYRTRGLVGVKRVKLDGTDALPGGGFKTLSYKQFRKVFKRMQAEADVALQAQMALRGWIEPDRKRAERILMQDGSIVSIQEARASGVLPPTPVHSTANKIRKKVNRATQPGARAPAQCVDPALQTLSPIIAVSVSANGVWETAAVAHIHSNFEDALSPAGATRSSHDEDEEDEENEEEEEGGEEGEEEGSSHRLVWDDARFIAEADGGAAQGVPRDSERATHAERQQEGPYGNSHRSVPQAREEDEVESEEEREGEDGGQGRDEDAISAQGEEDSQACSSRSETREGENWQECIERQESASSHEDEAESMSHRENEQEQYYEAEEDASPGAVGMTSEQSGQERQRNNNEIESQQQVDRNGLPSEGVQQGVDGGDDDVDVCGEGPSPSLSSASEMRLIKSQRQEYECMICLQTTGSGISLPCLHGPFCEGCLSVWSRHNRSCPCCRRKTGYDDDDCWVHLEEPNLKDIVEGLYNMIRRL